MELASLNRQDVADGNARQAVIIGGGGKRVVFFDEPARAAIRAYLASRDDPHAPLFLRHDNHRGRRAGSGGENWRLSPQSIWAIVKRYAREAGVPATTRDFRHVKAITMLDRGASLANVRDILGQVAAESVWRAGLAEPRRELEESFDRYSSTAEELAANLRDPRGSS